MIQYIVKRRLYDNTVVTLASFNDLTQAEYYCSQADYYHEDFKFKSEPVLCDEVHTWIEEK